MSNVEIVKVLLQYIGNDLEQDKAIAQGAIILLDAGKAPKQPEPEKKPAKKAAAKDPAPKRSPLDTGKLRALYKGNWSVKAIADELGVSEATVYNHLKMEGLKK